MAPSIEVHVVTERAPRAKANKATAPAEPAEPAPKPAAAMIIEHTRALDAILDTAAGVCKTTFLPATAAILLEADEAGGITLTATSNEERLVCKIPGTVIRPGRLLIPAESFTAVVRSCAAGPGAEVELQQDGHKVVFRGRGTKYELLCLDPDDHPQWPAPTVAASFTTNARAFADLIKRSAHGVARKDHRKVLMCAFLELQGLALRATGADGKVLFRDSIGLAESTGKPMTALLPLGAFGTIAKALAGATEKDEIRGSVSAGGRDLILALPNGGTLTIRTVEGKFPDCDQVIPRDFVVRAKIDRVALLDACMRAGVTADGKTRSMALELTAGALRFSTQSADTGTCEGEIAITDGPAAPMGLAFNVDLLRETLEALAGVERFTMAVRNEAQPVLFLADEKPMQTLLLMPIKLKKPEPPAAEPEEVD